MSRDNKNIPGPAAGISHQVHTIRSWSEYVTHADFTDGGGATGTWQSAFSIPKGAIILGVEFLLLQAWTGDTSTLTIGDGSDVDRYNTGTPSGSTAQPEGLDVGVPSGDEIHSAAVQPVVTVTSGTSFSSLSGGRFIIRFIYAGVE